MRPSQLSDPGSGTSVRSMHLDSFFFLFVSKKSKPLTFMLKSILLKSRQTTTKKKRESVEESNRKHALDDASARRLELHVLLV